MKESLKKIIEKNWFWAVIGLLTLIKFVISGSIPILPVYAPHDDLLMVEMAEALMEGQWLGPYHENTLVKGLVHPLFLCSADWLGLSYLQLLTLFNIGACLLFVYALSRMVSSKGMLAAAYGIMVFNPVFTAADTFQRVYRCSLTPGQVLFLLSFCFLFYESRKRRKREMVFWGIGSGILMWTVWNCREDGMWTYPLVGMVTVLILGSLILDFRKKSWNRREVLLRVGMAALPWITAWCGNLGLSAVNGHVYGSFVTTELNDSSFPSMIQSIYSVEPVEDIPMVAVPKSTMAAIYEISPSLSAIQETLDQRMEDWGRLGRYPDDGQVDNGLFFWAVRDAMARTGHYDSSEKAESFCRQVIAEISQAQENGTIGKRATMPSALMAPWHSSYGKLLIPTFTETVSHVLHFTSMVPRLENSQVSQEVTRKFEMMTGSLAVPSTEAELSLGGWLVPFSGSVTSVSVCDGAGTTVGTAELTESPDIEAYWEQTYGTKNPASQSARFSVSFPNLGSLPEILYLSVEFSDGTERKIPVSGILQFSDDRYELCIDRWNRGYEEAWQVEHARGRNAILRHIRTVYEWFTPWLTAAAVLIYMWLTVVWIRTKRDLSREWLFLSAQLGCFLLLTAGVVYTHISSCEAINGYYLSGTYPLAVGFYVTAFSAVAKLWKGHLVK